jgi:hypothetical protein
VEFAFICSKHWHSMIAYRLVPSYRCKRITNRHGIYYHRANNEAVRPTWRTSSRGYTKHCSSQLTFFFNEPCRKAADYIKKEEQDWAPQQATTTPPAKHDCTTPLEFDSTTTDSIATSTQLRNSTRLHPTSPCRTTTT